MHFILYIFSFFIPYIWDLLEWLTECGPASPAMAVYQEEGPRDQQLFSPQVWVSQLVLSICQNPEEVVSNASEETDLPAGVRASR